MTYSAPLGSTISNTHMRTPGNLSGFSGMCAVCTNSCTGTCEIGLSAVRGSEAIYPYETDLNQFASEKKYPLDYSHLNITGRVFGAWGCPEDNTHASYPNVSLVSTFGKKHPVPLKAPIILPAMAKLNWQDYFAGAALAGVVAVIGEDVVAKDKNLEVENGKVTNAPLLEAMVMAFRQYDQGLGDIVVQANADDEQLGVLDYALEKLPVSSVELKFGQAAKGIQGLGRVKTLEEALRLHRLGYLVNPDPTDPEVQKAYQNGSSPAFEKVGRLPMWDESQLIERINDLRKKGAKRICLKTGPFRPEDLLRLLKIAAVAEVDLVTFDGAGGGTGNSPAKMMNEWGIPTLELECMVYDMLHGLKLKGYAMPQVAITGGIAMEDQVFKALAVGAPYVGLVGIGRAAMAAAMAGKQIGNRIHAGNVPSHLKSFGSSIPEIFEDYKLLKAVYGDAVEAISPGAIGVYSYLERVETGLRQLMALNRKFDLSYLNREDLMPLSDAAVQLTGIKSAYEQTKALLNNL